MTSARASAEKGGIELSIIIPVHRDVPALARCLRALAGQTVPTGRFEVLVVDNGGNDGIEAAMAVAHPWARLLREPKPGSYAARNKALAQARGAVLAFTDADCLPHPDWLERGLAAVRAAGAPCVVAGRVEVFPHADGKATLAEAFEMEFAFRQELYVARDHFGVTANLFATRDVIDRIGPFDAELVSGGDRDWGMRAHAGGIPVLYEPSSVVRHPARRTLAELRAKNRRTQLGLLALGHVAQPRSRVRWAVWSLLPVRPDRVSFRRWRSRGGLGYALRVTAALTYAKWVRNGAMVRPVLRKELPAEPRPAAKTKR